MSAHEQMKNMLDQLMGTGRDGENNKFKVTFDDPRVCKSFLMNCCPHDILASTRMDLGDCPKIHDLALRADFEKASRHKDYYYDIDAMEHLSSFIADCDRRTEQAKKRLKETQQELSDEANSKAEIIHVLGEEVGTKLAKSEELGAQGLVDESMKLLEEMEELKKKKQQAEIEYRNSMPASSYQQQKLRVCEVCSAYLGIHDNDRRLADHFGGKLHLGFITIRSKLEDLKKSVAERREKREKEREDRRKEREMEAHSREASRKPSRSRSRSRAKRSRSGSRSRRKRSRSRSRSRNRRRRSRSGSRRRRSRSRSRHNRRRSRSRSRSRRSRRGGGRRSRTRSRSRSRKERSRSGERSWRKSPSPSKTRKRNDEENSLEREIVSTGEDEDIKNGDVAAE
ncbi:putative RNA-binding protein Luc7-like 1 isoform X6 [Lingula anatina]|uniref:RNA-binding protein Luc7-like 1 isoform X5 n=1 Tax=Lingula anatina TaxID=7574 RepID=A0A1S3J3U9_LINAN|nr:putative RNA-binding protein Luc7-like 1 isoform X5 [Lingula anatina]XP_013405089.1 putative RNA-binding protein Luc7-like 1 isoform X6 [Lingula anatina]|eukprot:XP_013405087.1 putative RNA-binding protein Luc7-like 1 isoform X5 [Lingula anatina]